MPKIAYLTNQFPAAVEWYVMDEIVDLRRRGVEVVPCSGRKIDEEDLPPELRGFARETLALQPIQGTHLLGTLWMCLSRFALIRDLLAETLVRSKGARTGRVRTLFQPFSEHTMPCFCGNGALNTSTSIMDISLRGWRW